jgi:hypothetical protein
MVNFEIIVRAFEYIENIKKEFVSSLSSQFINMSNSDSLFSAISGSYATNFFSQMQNQLGFVEGGTLTFTQFIANVDEIFKTELARFNDEILRRFPQAMSTKKYGKDEATAETKIINAEIVAVEMDISPIDQDEPATGNRNVASTEVSPDEEVASHELYINFLRDKTTKLEEKLQKLRLNSATALSIENEITFIRFITDLILETQDSSSFQNEIDELTEIIRAKIEKALKKPSQMPESIKELYLLQDMLAILKTLYPCTAKNYRKFKKAVQYIDRDMEQELRDFLEDIFGEDELYDEMIPSAEVSNQQAVGDVLNKAANSSSQDNFISQSQNIGMKKIPNNKAANFTDLDSASVNKILSFMGGNILDKPKNKYIKSAENKVKALKSKIENGDFSQETFHNLDSFNALLENLNSFNNEILSDPNRIGEELELANPELLGAFVELIGDSISQIMPNIMY